MITEYRVLERWMPGMRPSHIEVAVRPRAYWSLALRKALWAWRVHPNSRRNRAETLWATRDGA